MGRILIRYCLVLLVNSVRKVAKAFKALEKMETTLKGKANGAVKANGSAKKTI
jgi:hypothetical protein